MVQHLFYGDDQLSFKSRRNCNVSGCAPEEDPMLLLSGVLVDKIVSSIRILMVKLNYHSAYS